MPKKEVKAKKRKHTDKGDEDRPEKKIKQDRKILEFKDFESAKSLHLIQIPAELPDDVLDGSSFVEQDGTMTLKLSDGRVLLVRTEADAGQHQSWNLFLNNKNVIRMASKQLSNLYHISFAPEVPEVTKPKVEPLKIKQPDSLHYKMRPFGVGPVSTKQSKPKSAKKTKKKSKSSE